MKRLLMLGCIVLFATTTFASPSFVLIALVDTSASVADREVYVRAIKNLVAGLQPGQRFVIGLITDLTYSAPDVPFDAPYPGCTIWDTRSECAQKKSKFATDLDGAFQRIRARAASQRTAIIEGGLLVQKLRAREENVFAVFFTDGIEDSERLHFETMIPSATTTERMVEAQRRAHTLPNLAGVKVQMAGLRAPTSTQVAALEQFWVNWFRATRACVDAQQFTPLTTQIPLSGWTMNACK